MVVGNLDLDELVNRPGVPSGASRALGETLEQRVVELLTLAAGHDEAVADLSDERRRLGPPAAM